MHLYRSDDDKEAIGVLFERYMHLVYGVCRKYMGDEDSKDAVMQIFENLMKKIHQHEINNFPGWLYVLSRNHCLMWHRSQKSFQDAKNKYSHLMELDYILHPDNNETDNTWEKLELGLNNLSVEQQQCIRLFYLNKKCYKEISLETGYDIKKVKSYIQNGKRNLKVFLDNHNEGSLEK